MITEEERTSIVEEVFERIVLRLPELVGNLMMSQVKKSKITSDFYKANPDLKGHEDVIRAIVSQEEGMDTLEDYEKILERSAPKIRDIVRHVDKLDTTKVNVPTRSFDEGMF